MSLLNLSKQIDLYSSLWFLWEGKQQGEGYLRSVKSELTIGLNKNWQKWLLNNLHLDKSFTNISNDILKESNHRKTKTMSEIKFYKNKNEAIVKTFTYRPFFGFRIGNIYYVGYVDGNQYLGLELVLREHILNNAYEVKC
jgi:hypothetical protein